MPDYALSPADCADIIRSANRVAVLTGAGISTAAGVPDFRGPKGLYVTRAYDPEKVFDIHYFAKDPEPFYQFNRDFLGTLDTIKPTFTHHFLAKLEQSGKFVTLITQNIDGLHQRAGSKRVLPFHGDYETAHCRSCRQAYSGADLRALLEVEQIPHCPRCGGVLKPDVVFFGENVLHLDHADRAISESDLLLVLGSSLQVYPAAALPSLAQGAVVVVNMDPVGLRPSANTYIVDADLDAYFKAMDEESRINN